jgi:hypothetical protein
MNKSCFSTLVFMKSKLESKFTNHLDFIVCIFAKKNYTLEKVSLQDANLLWKATKV